GGAGFIGQRLARRILERGTLAGQPVDEVLLFDNVMPPFDGRMKFIAGDIADPALINQLIDRADIGVFHLASVVSGGAEQDFDLAMKVNLHGHLHLLEALRRVGGKPRHVFSSSIAAYGGAHVPKHVADATRQTPQTTYGATKSIGELLVND